MDKFKEILLLKNLSGIGKVKIYKNYWHLLTEANGLDDLIDMMENQSNFSRKVLEMARDDAEELYNYIIDSDIHVITVFDDDYPKKLEVMGNKRPLILYIKGNVNALIKPNIAIIGTRKPSENTESFEENLVKGILNSSDRVIVSGLALGCDKIAHKTTVDKNRATVAVLPSGVNVIKPARHKKLADEIIATGGCLVSEYEPNSNVFKSNYVERDQIVAAFCDATFVVECGVKSGTMHTVNAAKKFKRQIFTYIPSEKPEGAYEGNEFILNNNYDAIKVEDIEKFINDIKNINFNKNGNFGQQKLV